MKRYCAFCGTAQNFELQERGWVCDVCEGAYPYFWGMSDRVSAFAEEASHLAGNRAHYKRMKEFIRARTYQDLADFCRLMVSANIRTEMYWQRALAWLSWMPRLIQADLQAGRPLTVTMERMEDVQSSFDAFSRHLNSRAYHGLTRVAHMLTAVAAVQIQAACLDWLRDHPEDWRFCEDMREKLLDMREMMQLLQAREPRYVRRQDSPGVPHASLLRNMRSYAASWTDTLWTMRRLTGLHIQKRYQAELPASPALADAALHILVPDWALAHRSWIRGTRAWALEEVRGCCAISLELCHTLRATKGMPDPKNRARQLRSLQRALAQEQLLRRLKGTDKPHRPGTKRRGLLRSLAKC